MSSFGFVRLESKSRWIGGNGNGRRGDASGLKMSQLQSSILIFLPRLEKKNGRRPERLDERVAWSVKWAVDGLLRGGKGTRM